MARAPVPQGWEERSWLWDQEWGSSWARGTRVVLGFILVLFTSVKSGLEKEKVKRPRAELLQPARGGRGTKRSVEPGILYWTRTKARECCKRAETPTLSCCPARARWCQGQGPLAQPGQITPFPPWFYTENSVPSPGAEGSGSSRGARWWEKGLGAAPECLILARGNLGTRGVFSSPDPGVKVLPSSQPQERHWASFCFSLENPLYSFHVA